MWLALLAGSSAVHPATPSLPGPIVLTQVPARAEIPPARAGGFLRAGLGDGGRIILVSEGGRPTILTGGFASAADPEVSFDGRRILFAGRKTPLDPWCVYEMRVDGSDLRQVTCGPGSARSPVYLPTMHTLTPTATERWDLVAFVGGRPGEINEAGEGEAHSLYACRLDGSALRRLTFNLSSDIDPGVLPDGRLIFASWQRPTLERGPLGRFVLLAANSDGTDLVPYSATEGAQVKQMPAAVSAGGLLVFVEAEAVAGDGAGRLASVSLARPLHSHRAITEDGDGLFLAPSALADGGVLVSARPADGKRDHGVFRIDPRTGRRTKIFDEPGWHDIQAKILAPRPVPDGRSSPVQDSDQNGKIYALDVNIDDLPPGSMKPGAARRVRVLEGIPVRQGGLNGSPVALRRLLGEAPIAEDGSFQILVPANLPLQIQVLDEDGLALRSGAWIWTRNHFNQGCVGCHEDPERTPPNRFARALASPAAGLNMPSDLRRTVDYRHDVAPIVRARCLACHGRGGASPDLTPDGKAPDRAYRALVPAYARPGSARTSRLVWHVFGRNMSRPWDGGEFAKEARPVPGGTAPLGAEERRTIVEWIDTGAAWDARGAAGGPQ